MEQYNCLIVAAARLLKVHPTKLIKEIGHDGKEIFWPEYDDIRKYRAYTLTELQQCFIRRKMLLADIELNSLYTPEPNAYTKIKVIKNEYFWVTIAGKKGILYGFHKNVGHAATWDRDRIIQPKEENLIFKDIDLFNLRSERKKWEKEQKEERRFIQSTR